MSLFMNHCFFFKLLCWLKGFILLFDTRRKLLRKKERKEVRKKSMSDNLKRKSSIESLNVSYKLGFIVLFLFSVLLIERKREKKREDRE